LAFLVNHVAVFLYSSPFVLIQKWSKKSRTIKGIFACACGFSSKKSACENYLVTLVSGCRFIGKFAKQPIYLRCVYTIVLSRNDFLSPHAVYCSAKL